ncbi:MAG: histidine phosphatase family protein [Deltaproteobacteria bacterium]|nr:histidine phosphatase family protein [Deltaproteobacteria bacterium]
MGTLLLIRHGQASYGEVDYDRLSSRGHEQARAIGRFLARSRLDATYAGPLRRQQETIATARAEGGEAIPAPVTVDELAEYPAFEMLQHFIPRLAEGDPRFAALTTAPTPKLLDEAFHAILGRWARDEWSVDGVERIEAFVARVRAGLDRIIRAAASGARIAVVTSAGPIGVAVGLTLGVTAERMVRTSATIRNASISELLFRGAGFAWHPDQISLLTFNLTAHLPDELHTHR